MPKLNGKTAVITGGSSGIGLATAKVMLSEGAKVIIFARNQTTLDEAVAQCHGNVVAVRGDVTRSDDLDRLVRTAIENHATVDVLFVNAGMSNLAVAFDQVDEKLFDAVMEVNVKGAFFTIQKFLPALSDNASIILTTSCANVKGQPNSSVYAASKAALRSLARTLSAELIGRGIRVNAVRPGPIETRLWRRAGIAPDKVDELCESIRKMNPMKRFGTAEEVANAVVFLASNDSSYIMGAEIAVDGGFTEL